MRLSRYFLPLLKETPTDAQIVSHQLMLRAGLVRQTSAGIYAWLPVGLRVLDKIADIVRREQDRAGAIELLMPTIQSADLWRQSGRYDAYGPEMLRFKDRHEREMLYGPTNEEMITALFRDSVRSYRDLPRTLYHIQWKFRDEVRPRFGVMRGREFLMKDAYSFDLDEAGGKVSYNAMFEAYLRTFAAMGLKAVPVRAPTGPIGGDMSHEFHILAETGESEIFYDSALENVDVTDPEAVSKLSSVYAMEAEEHEKVTNCPVPAERLLSRRGIEVGHIFFFGTKYSASMGLSVQGQDGKPVTPQMGSYGIGVSRLVGAVIEACHDEDGIIWPEAIAPFKVGLINLRSGDAACDVAADALYARLQRAGIETLYDDRDERGGAKFAGMDLVGIPWQLVVGPKGVSAGVVELKHRRTGERHELSVDSALEKLAG
ncbi:proline--tRNA ligase [Sphingosinicella microcystinivorans]|uniref:proline--tRNA ligase n=1 Tax=Sphingosinicella microcystinivorans TaxID=335406 RepID=UPI0022F3B1B4|nr:proline--tRNA ligase [Sphingosinicella microcystinivorans]WBX83372.1 proline--tRNA ligase [Sphingosinicella microcystinivorans]